jgi:beta-phosphoglucomutase-like phosphatase (HAD superfamily)
VKLLFTDITGAMLSSTVTVAVLEATLPFTSSTVRVTVFTPMFEQLNVVLSNQDVDKPKPHPEIYTKAATILGVLPSECLIVEDNHHSYSY